MLIPLLNFAQTNTLPVLDTVRLPIAVNQIALDVEGNLLALDTRGNRVLRAAAQFGYDSVVVVGGAGTSGEGFLLPTRIRSIARQEIFVLDYGNRRLAILNPNLRVVAERQYDNLPVEDRNQQRYLAPLSFDVGPLGDLYLLNQDDNQVYKFDRSGAFQLAFGGLGYGEGQLLNPSDVAATSDNWVAVADTVRNQVFVYDNFGTYRYRLEHPTLPPHWRGLQANGDNLLLTGPGYLGIMGARSRKLSSVPVPPETRHAAVGADRLAVLLGERTVVVYQLPK